MEMDKMSVQRASDAVEKCAYALKNIIIYRDFDESLKSFEESLHSNFKELADALGYTISKKGDE